MLRRVKKVIQRPVSNPITDLIDMNISEFLNKYVPEEYRNPDIYQINYLANYETVYEKILDEKNKEKILLVVEDESEAKIRGVLADSDILNWGYNCIKDKVVIDDPNSFTALDIANKYYFSIKDTETVQDAINMMRDKMVKHIVVESNDKQFVGIICKRHIHKRISEILVHKK